MKINKDILIHIIGIGGIGMSGIAEILSDMRYHVQGSDININSNILRLNKKNIKTFKGHKLENLKNVNLIVYSTAVKKSNVELKFAKKNKIPSITRAEILSQIVKLKNSIAISGSHGKTTTTSLISSILNAAKMNPTVINGGIINQFGTNTRLGSGKWMVVEADESDGTFVKLPSTIAVVTNIDKEHLDFYKNYENLENAFIKFINKTPPIGKTMLCLDSLNLRKIIGKINSKNYLTYGFDKNANYQIININYKLGKTSFSLKVKSSGKKKLLIKNILLNLIGKHNVLNATASIAICLNLGININIIKNALKNFSGVQRRLTKIFIKNQREFYDDYAHHPTEISSVLDGLKTVYKNRKIITIFQPHRYSRIKNLKREFASSFSMSDVVVLCPIYAAGEKKDKSFKEISFAKSIAKLSKSQVILIKDELELIKYLNKNLIKNEIVIGMGAGSISKWMHNLKDRL